MVRIPSCDYEKKLFFNTFFGSYYNDYSYTYVQDYLEPNGYRKDLPVPIILIWENGNNVVNTEISINNIDGNKEQIYYTVENSIAKYSLVSDRMYYYKIPALYENGVRISLEDGRFLQSQIEHEC